jgi:PII-like signaling protein
MKPPIKLLLIFVNETDRWNEAPLFKAVIQRLRQLEVSGATAHAGIMGFGRHHRLHHKGLFGVSDDRPITISVIDEEEKLRAAAAEIAPMLKEGLMVLVDADLLHAG